MLCAIVSFFGIAPFVFNVSTWLGNGVQALADANLLPLMSVVKQAAACSSTTPSVHRHFLPLGVQQSVDTGRSLLFLVEANPGPGFGLLLAFALFGVGTARASAPGAIIIQFLGGIRKMFFPFVLMKPVLIVAMIGGGMTGVATNAIFGSGLRAPAAPGSIIAVLAQTLRGSYLGVILSVVLSAAVTFLIASMMCCGPRAASSWRPAAATCPPRSPKPRPTRARAATRCPRSAASGRRRRPPPALLMGWWRRAATEPWDQRDGRRRPAGQAEEGRCRRGDRRQQGGRSSPAPTS